MEEGLKILKLEYLSNHLLDHNQILDWRLDDQTIFYKSLKWRWPHMEVGLKILKVEYISNQDYLIWKTTLKNKKYNILVTTYNGRRPQNIKTGISQQPLTGS